VTIAVKRRAPAPQSRQRGLSIVEFMVGIAVGLFIVGGTVKLFVDYVVGSRRTLEQTRVNQDLRAAADLVVRDVRRAGYWRNSTSGLFTGAAGAVNPYQTIAASPLNSEVTYNYDKDGVDAVDASEQFGFRLNGGALQVNNGGAWQQVTDPGTLTITRFVVGAPVVRQVELWESCPCLWKLTCTPASFTAAGANFATRPLLNVRQYSFTIRGRSTSDMAVEREITETVRVRNDQTTGACPI
jgi:prepilin peptidase dependent protein B